METETEQNSNENKELDIPRMQKTLVKIFKGIDLTDTSDEETVKDWILKHENTFGAYINGFWMHKDNVERSDQCKIHNTFNAEVLCDVCVPKDKKVFSYAVECASIGFQIWSSMSLTCRARILDEIAQAIKTYENLFAAIHSVSSGEPFSKAKDKDVPNLIKSFYYYSSCSMHLEDWIPSGPVCVINEETNNPCLTFSSRVSSILASGSSILMLSDYKSCLTSLLLAETLTDAGLPPGVINVIPIDQDKFVSIGQSPVFSKMIFTGSFSKSASYIKMAADAHISCECLIPRKPLMIIYGDCDCQAAAIGIVEAVVRHDTVTKTGAWIMMIQASIYVKFFEALQTQFYKFLVNNNEVPIGSSPMSIKDKMKHLKKCLRMVEIFSDENQCSEDNPMVGSVIFGTVQQSIEEFNKENHGVPVTIWTNEKTALKVAFKLKSPVVWVNSYHVIDTEIPHFGVHSSGSSVEGGKETLFHHMSVTHPKAVQEVKEEHEVWMSSASIFENSHFTAPQINRTIDEYKTFVTSGIKRSFAGKVKYEESIFIPSIVQDVITNSVNKAVAAQPGWESLTGIEKRQKLLPVIYRIQEYKPLYVLDIHQITKVPVEECGREVDLAVDWLLYLASEDQDCGPTRKIDGNFMVLQKRFPLGIVGIQCPEEKPFLSFLLLLFVTIIHGNAVVAITNQINAQIAFKICQAFQDLGFPEGIVNVISASNKNSVGICKDPRVNAIWFTDVPPKVIYFNVYQTQRVFCANNIWNDFTKTKQLKCTVECTFIKTIILSGIDDDLEEKK